MLPSFIIRPIGYVVYLAGYYSLRAVYSMLTADPAVVSFVLTF